VQSPPVNPYEPPKFADAPVAPLAFADLDIGRAVTDSFEACKRHFPLWLGVLFVAFFLVVLSLITIVGYFVLVPVFVWGTTKFLLNMIDGGPSFDDLFAGFKNYLSVLGRVLLVSVVYIVLAFLSQGLTFVGQYLESWPLMAVGWLVYLAFAFVVSPRLMFAFFLVVDRDMRALESFAVAWNMTQGKTLKVLGLSMLSGLIGFAGIFACGVGMIWTLTMSWVMYASAYRQMIGPPLARPAVAAAW
jgi:uncharacterized membrane protein